VRKAARMRKKMEKRLPLMKKKAGLETGFKAN
jgi:hypothetical protein